MTPVPQVQAALDSSKNEYMMSIGPVNGSTSANYVYASFFNPTGSGKTLVINRVRIEGFATTTAVHQNLDLRRSTAASGGTQISAANILKKHGASSDSVAELRAGAAAAPGVTVTGVGGTDTRLMSVIAQAAAGTVHGILDVNFTGRAPVVLQEGEGVYLTQTAAGDIDQRITVIFEWSEDASAPSQLDEYMVTYTRVENAAAADYKYATFFNPAGSGKTALIKRLRVHIGADTTAVYTNDIYVRRITAASAGTQISAANIPKKHSSSGNSVMELRHTTVTATLAGSAESSLVRLTPPGTTNIGAIIDMTFGTSTSLGMGTSTESIVIQPGEGVALVSSAAGDIDELVTFSLEWQEVASAPSTANEYLFAFGRVELAASANQVYHTFFNPAASGKTAVVKRIGIRIAADTTAVYQAVSVRRITAASAGTQTASADIPKKHTSSADSVMEFRRNNVTATLAGSVDSRIFSVTGTAAVGQQHAMQEITFAGDEQLVLKEGEGIALYTEAAGDVDQYVGFYVEWEERAVSPTHEYGYSMTIGNISGSTSSGYVYATLFNPVGSATTTVIKKIKVMNDAVTTAGYIAMSVRRITTASAGTQITAADVPRKNTSSGSPTSEVRRTGVTATLSGSADSRLLGVITPGAVTGAAATHLSGHDEVAYEREEEIVLAPGEGIALYQEAAGDADLRVKLYVEWQEVASTPTTEGEYSINIGPISGSNTNGYVYASIFNPASSGKVYVVDRLNVKVLAAGAATIVNGYIYARRTTAASSGTQVTTTNIPKKHSTSGTSGAEIRHTNVTASFVGTASTSAVTIPIPRAVGAINGMVNSSVYDEDIILRPGEGLALYQEGTSFTTNTNTRVILGITWAEQALDQVDWQLFANSDAASVGSTLTTENTAATLAASGDAFRLRALMNIDGSKLRPQQDQFKLQFAQKSGTCDTAFSGETYADVTLSTLIAYEDNVSPADGIQLIANASDPQDASRARIYQTYEELNNFTNASTTEIKNGQDGLWDFALVDNGAPANTSYCFRIIRANGDVLETYTQIPEVATAAGASLTLSVGTNVFPTLTPGVAVFATSTISVSTSNATGWNVSLYGQDRVTGNTTLDLSTDAATGLTDQLEWIPGAATTSAGNAVRIASFDNSGDVLAFRVMAASGTIPFRASTWWGTTDSYSDSATTLWAGIASTTAASKLIGNSSISSGGVPVHSTVLYYLDVPMSQVTGIYDGDLIYTAVVNP